MIHDWRQFKVHVTLKAKIISKTFYQKTQNMTIH